MSIAILSPGPPPARHADRVTAEMLRELARRKATLHEAMVDALLDSKNGNPKAQQRMANRLLKAGASHVSLKPGKRGRFELLIYTQAGWNPWRDAEIGPDDPVPEKPWIACHVTALISRGYGRTSIDDFFSAPVLFVSHHAFSRSSQRAGLRMLDDAMETVREIWNAASDFLGEVGAKAWFNPPPAGHRIRIGTTGHDVVLQRHFTREALVAATVI